MDDDDGAIRKDAALCCCRLVANSFSGLACSQFGSSRSSRTGGKRRRLVEEVWLATIIYSLICTCFFLIVCISSPLTLHIAMFSFTCISYATIIVCFSVTNYVDFMLLGFSCGPVSLLLILTMTLGFYSLGNVVLGH